MKLTLVVLAGLLALAWSQSEPKYKVADKEFLDKQQKVLTLFYHINQPTVNEEHLEIIKSFKVDGKTDQYYTKPEVFDQFMETIKYDPLPKGEIFSITYDRHLEQAIALFKVLYYAKDFDAFYKSAVLSRYYQNEGLFLYAYSVALVHRPDTYGIILPPIYEVYPHYFFPSEVIHEAYRIKQEYHGEGDEHTHQGHSQTEQYHGYTIAANYSGHYLNLHPEQYLSYYLEDIGINSFYYYYHLYYPFWMDGEEFGLKNDYRGELYYFVYQQLVARYYLERLSNHKGEIPILSLDDGFVETPYYPSLEYPNGMEFPTRPAFAKLNQYFTTFGQSVTNKIAFSFGLVKDYLHRIVELIDGGYIFTGEGKLVDLYNDENSLNLLANIIQSNPESPNRRYYGAWQKYAHHLLGYSHQPLDSNRVAPSALEHFETSLRDPVFYQLYKRVVLKFQRYFANLPAYRRKDLVFPGVKIEKFEVDRLITYFDKYYTDISNAVWDSQEERKDSTFKVRAQQNRLNHKPFTYKVQVKSDKDQSAVVKVFFGPKYDEYGRYINISVNRLNFIEIDKFVYELKAGDNVIKRNSLDSKIYGPDRIGDSELYRKVMDAMKGQGELKLDGSQSYFRFPYRYMLPKGSYDGIPYQFYVIVYPYVPYKGRHNFEENVYFYPKPGTGGPYIDEQSLGYPFDRFIKYDGLFYDIPNAHFYEAKVYHRKAEDINASQAEEH